MSKPPTSKRRSAPPPTASNAPAVWGRVRVGALMSLPGLLQECGVDPAQLLAEFNLNLAYFDDPEHTIPFATMGALLGRCAERTRCPHFGLAVGQNVGISALGAIGFLAQSAPDVREALGLLASHSHLHNPGATIEVVESDAVATFSYSIVQIGIDSHEQILDGAMAAAFNIMRGLCGQSWLPTQVRFAHARPGDVAAFRQFFRADLYFDAEETALVFSRQWLDQVPSSADRLLHKMMHQRVSELALAAGDDVVGQLRRLLPRLLTTHSASLAGAAKAVGLSARTLTRRLAAEGTSFTQLRADACHTIACQLLAGTRMAAGEIAALLGYANLSAFTRAFGRWSGVGPAQWRASRRQRSPRRSDSGGHGRTERRPKRPS